MFKKVINSITGNENRKSKNNQIKQVKKRSEKTKINIPKILDLSSIDYYPLPPSPNRWESNYDNKPPTVGDLFEIIEASDKQIHLAEIKKLSMEDRPDPAYKIILPSNYGFIEIDKNGKAKNLPGCLSAIAMRNKKGNLVKELGLDYSIYRIGIDTYANHFALMDKESILHIYNNDFKEVRRINLASDPRVNLIRESDVSFYGDVRTSIRCIDVSSDGNLTLFTIADSAFLVDNNGSTIWARSMPLGEGWVREFAKGDRVGTSQEVFDALAFMHLDLPVLRENIRTRYRELSMQYHPDLNHNIGDHGEMMKRLNIHHDVLTGMDSKELSKDLNKGRITYRRTKPDSVNKYSFKDKNVTFEISIEINSGEPALDWIYAAAISNNTGGTYLGTYSGKVIKINTHGEPEYALDVSNVPRQIIEGETYLYILTDTRLYIVGEKQSLVNIIDVHSQEKLAISEEGFGLYAGKTLSWYTISGKLIFRIGTKNPIRTFYTFKGYMVVETRQNQAVVAYKKKVAIPDASRERVDNKGVINEGSGKQELEKARQAELDKDVQATIENLSAMKRAGRYDEAIVLLLKEVEVQERENQIQKWGVGPWWYHQLAIIYRKQKDYQNEINILNRYLRQENPSGNKGDLIISRLKKAKDLYKNSN